MSEQGITKEQMREELDSIHPFRKQGVDPTDISNIVDDTIMSNDDKNTLIYEKNDDGSINTKYYEHSKLYGAIDGEIYDSKPSLGKINNIEGDTKIIKDEGDQFAVYGVKEYDKSGDVIKDDPFYIIDGSNPDKKYESQNDGDRLDDDDRVRINERIDSDSHTILSDKPKFEEVDEKNKLERMKEGEDPRTVNNNRYDVVAYNDQVIIVRNDEQNRIQDNAVGIPSDEDGEEIDTIMNTLKGNRTAVDGEPIDRMDKEKLMDKTGSDSIEEAIDKFTSADEDTIDEFFEEDYRDKEPTDIDIWEVYTRQTTSVSSRPHLPVIMELSDVYGANKEMTMDEIRNEKISKERIMLSLSTNYIDDIETVRKMFDQIDEDGNVNSEDIQELLGEHVKYNRNEVARKLMPRLQEIENAFEVSDDVIEEDGTSKISLTSSPVIGTGYSTYTFRVKQTINGRGYFNGPYYQSSYRENGVSKSKYHAIEKTFEFEGTGYDGAVSNI